MQHECLSAPRTGSEPSVRILRLLFIMTEQVFTKQSLSPWVKRHCKKPWGPSRNRNYLWKSLSKAQLFRFPHERIAETQFYWKWVIPMVYQKLNFFGFNPLLQRHNFTESEWFQCSFLVVLETFQELFFNIIGHSGIKRGSFISWDNFPITSEAATGGVLEGIGVLKNFAKFTGKRLCQSLFF